MGTDLHGFPARNSCAGRQGGSPVGGLPVPHGALLTRIQSWRLSCPEATAPARQGAAALSRRGWKQLSENAEEAGTALFRGDARASPRLRWVPFEERTVEGAQFP